MDWKTQWKCAIKATAQGQWDSRWLYIKVVVAVFAVKVLSSYAGTYSTYLF